MVSVSQATLVLAVAAAAWIPVVGLLILLVGLGSRLSLGTGLGSDPVVRPL